MAKYDSKNPDQPGQYPAPNFTVMGLPTQDFGSGAPGSPGLGDTEDVGGVNTAGQYPEIEGFTGVPLGGTGAPGTLGPQHQPDGPDEVKISKSTHYKGIHEVDDNPDGFAQGSYGEKVYTAKTDIVNGTDANSGSYGAEGGRWELVGVKGNTPRPGSDQYQTGNANTHIMYGGWLKGQRPAVKQHPDITGPGT